MATSLKSKWTYLSQHNMNNLGGAICWNEETKVMYKIDQHTLHRYCCNKNSWIKCNSFKEGVAHGSVVAIASAGNKIHILTPSGSLLIINTVNNKCTAIDNLMQTGFGCQGIMINNEFHAIGGSQNNKHLKWNNKSQQFDILHDINDGHIGHHRLIKLKHKVLMLGGFDYDMGCGSNSISEYDITANKWNKLEIKLPRKELTGFGCIAVLRNQFILILGGRDDNEIDQTEQDDIYIYSVRDGVFTKSKIRCPERDEFVAINVHDPKKDQSVVFGFVRSEWHRSEIDQHLFPPEYLIRIMGKYYVKEEIHLFDYYGCTKHWKIDVFDLFS